VGSAPRVREFLCYFFLWGVHEGLGKYIIPIDTIEVLRERTVRNSRGRLLERVEEWFRRRLHYCIIDSNGGHFEHFL
jgi:hypothetical protein